MQLVDLSNNKFIGTPNHEQIKPYNGFQGRFLHFFGQTQKVYDTDRNQYFYYKKKDLAKTLVGKKVKLSNKQVAMLNRRIKEIANPHKVVNTLNGNLNSVFDKLRKTEVDSTYEKRLIELDKIKQDHSFCKQVYYKQGLSEIGNKLKPGDILVRKYHEDNPNPICKAQKFFGKNGYREAYKCSHLAMYIGESEGKHWIAEATMPDGNDPQIRQLQLDDKKFELKDKNQYVVFRNKNEYIATEAAKIAGHYSTKANSENKQDLPQKMNSYKYSFIEAARSLWHFKNFDYFAKQRVFKYYSDDHNQVPLQYIFSKRGLYCSEFVLLAIQMAEMKKNHNFQQIIKKSPPPASNENKYTGLRKLVARISYVVRRAFWCRYMAIKYSKEMNQVVNTKVDFLRTTPQDAVNYFIGNGNRNYEIVFMINKESDRK